MENTLNCSVELSLECRQTPYIFNFNFNSHVSQYCSFLFLFSVCTLSICMKRVDDYYLFIGEGNVLSLFISVPCTVRISLNGCVTGDYDDENESLQRHTHN